MALNPEDGAAQALEMEPELCAVVLDQVMPGAAEVEQRLLVAAQFVGFDLDVSGSIDCFSGVHGLTVRIAYSLQVRNHSKIFAALKSSP